MDPVSNTVSAIAGFLRKHGMCTREVEVDLAHELLSRLTGEYGELEFTSIKRDEHSIDARRIALEQACMLAKADGPGYLGLGSPQKMVEAAEVFAKFLIGKKSTSEGR